MPAIARSIRHLSSSPERPLEEVAGRADELAKEWMRSVLDRASLDEIERMPMDGLARELPGLLADLLRSTSGDREAAAGSEHCRRVALLVGFRGREAPTALELASDVAALESVLVSALHKDVEALEPRVFLEGVERIGRLFAGVHAAGSEELMRSRSLELERLANTDALTGLFNRRHLEEQLDHLRAVSRRYGHPFAVILFDLVGLKQLNDAYGHAAGDGALTGVAAAATSTVRSVDTVVRLSGDEFCVLAPHQTASLARGLGDRLVAAAGKVPRPDGRGVEISIGVSACPEHSVEGSELIDMADAAMYRARRAGVAVGVANATDHPALRGALASSEGHAA